MNPLTSIHSDLVPSGTTSPVESTASAPSGGNEHDSPSHFHLYSFLLGLAVATGLVGGSVYLLRRPEPPPIAIHPPPTAAPTPTASPTPLPLPITVFVSGAVAQPGLYSLPVNARVGEVLEQAGGLTENANAIAVNQAEPLWDGAQVHVPEMSPEGAEASLPEPPSGVSGSARVVPAERSAGVQIGAAAGLIGINSGSAAELETLPGIGPSKAQAIIANRPFQAVDDLELVPGIGAKTVEQLRELVSLE